jgi:hypothetical protein
MGGAGLEPERYQFLRPPLGVGRGHPFTIFFSFLKKKKTIFKFKFYIIELYFFYCNGRISISY